MNKNTKDGPSQMINIRFGSLLPWPFQFLACVGLLLALLLATEHPWTAIVFSVCALFVLTSSEGTEIDLVNRRFREYTSIFFLRMGEWISYDSMQKIYVNKSKVRQRMTPTRAGLTKSFTFDQFCVWVKFDDEETVELMRHKNKNKVMSRAKVWSARLDVPLTDNTGIE